MRQTRAEKRFFWPLKILKKLKISISFLVVSFAFLAMPFKIKISDSGRNVE